MKVKKLRFYSHDTKGKLITFCGLDGCGKTTMINLLEKYLEKKGETVFLTKQPTDSMRNPEMFRTYMDKADHSAYDYRALSFSAAADRLQHTEKVILPALRAGKIVISDRYFYSCLANLRARGYTKDNWIYQAAKYIPAPDLAFFIDVSPELAINRVRAREEEKDGYIDTALQYSLHREYRDICRSCHGIRLSGETSEAETFATIAAEIDNLLRKDALQVL